MAGQPRKRAMIEEIDRMTREWDDGASHLEFIVDWTASGKTLLELAKAINDRRGFDPNTGVSRNMVSKYANGLAPDAEKQLIAARRPGSHALTDQSIQIADEAKDKDDAATARVKVGARQWLAERWNREELGAAPKQGVNVNVTVAGLHLDALRKLAVEEQGEGEVRNARARVSSVPDRLISATEDATVLTEDDANGSGVES